MMLRLALLIALLPVAAQAETYKWVDEHGVVTYSNTAPPAASRAQTVAERISVYASEPMLMRAGAVDRRLDLAEAEWLQRQQLMALQTAAYPTFPSYPVYRTAAYYPVSVGSFPARQSRRAASRRR